MSEINQNLELKILQKLSPQQIQLIKLLEMPIIELEQKIKKEIEENPALEEGKEFEEEPELQSNNDVEPEKEKEEPEEEIVEYQEDNIDDFSADDYYDDDEIPNYKLKENNYAEETDRTFSYFSEEHTFHEYLFSQLSTLDISPEDKAVAEYFIGSFDDAGYLRRELQSIVNDLLFRCNISIEPEKAEKLLKYLQEQLEPAGVGAQNLQEALLLQVKRKLSENKKNKTLKLCYIVLDEYFNEISKKHYSKIMNKLNIENDDMRLIINEIKKLNPKPGNSFTNQNKRNVHQIVPDFLLTNYDDELVITLNSNNVPPLRVSNTYKKMLDDFQHNKNNKKTDKETITFVKHKLDSAKWYIEAIRQRGNTLVNTMQAILNYQLEYFQTGDESKLKPMILKDIAQITGLDISTISRVANSKYIQTQYGIFPLKFFFSEGLENSDGEEVSTRKIKKILKEAIDKENKSKPLTDEKLANLLQEKGYKIARRTVAKYREQMGILVARLRKNI